MAEAAFPGANGKIAFSRGVNTGAIHVMERDGSGVTQLTSGGVNAEDESPTWSPDGSKIAFARGNNIVPDVWVMNSDATGLTRLTFSELGASDPAWSPDGKQLVYTEVVLRPGCLPFCRTEIFVMDADGTDRRRLTDNDVHDVEPAWSPDGSHIVFSRQIECPALSPCPFDLVRIAPDGTGERTLLANGHVNRDPDWSPDGTRIAFASSGAILHPNHFNIEVFTMSSDGSDVRLLTPVPDGSRGWLQSLDPAWSPDGTKIAFKAAAFDDTGRPPASVTDDSEILVVDADEPTVSRLTDTSSEEGWPDWQPLNRPPDCDITAGRVELWPPNHKLRRVSVSGGSDPDADEVSLAVTAVTQDEPVRGRGDNTTPDAVTGSLPNEVLLRAERSPRGDGRVYRLSVQGSDGRGGTCEGEATVEVRRHHDSPAVDSAPPSFDSFG
jgi:TolB protein